MDLLMIANASLSFAATAGILITCGFAVFFFYNKYSKKAQQMKLTANKQQRHDDKQQHMVQRTNELSDCIVKIVAIVTALKWQEYKDSHNIDKITLTQLATFAKECSNEAYTKIDISAIDFSYVLFNQDYVNFLIINSVFTEVKHLMDTDVDLYNIDE